MPADFFQAFDADTRHFTRGGLCYTPSKVGAKSASRARASYAIAYAYFRL